MHFYDKDGKPAYEVPNRSAGGMRPTTITDARKHGYVASVTTIMGQLDKPGLEYWKRTQLIEALKTLDWHAEGSIYDLFKQADLLVEDKKGNKRGTEVHDRLEKYFLTGKVVKKDSLIILSVQAIIEARMEIKGAVPERSFYREEGFGGKVDLCNPDENWVIDFKTKAKDKLTEKELIYDEHLMQLAAYRKGLDLPTARCYNLFISTTKPGEVLLVEHKEEDLQRGWKMFELLLLFWRIKNNV